MDRKGWTVFEREMDARERALFESGALVNEALRHDLELYKKHW